MIEEISIKNVGGIASASMRLEKGFTVITGESGSGKSSLVRAMELVGGKRSQTAFIRAGEEDAAVEAVLSGISSDLLTESTEDGEENLLFARRILSRNGRNRSFFQNRSTSFSTFASMMNETMRIQSQFAQIELLDTKRQLSILDSCCGERSVELRISLTKIFDEALRCERELRVLKSREQELKQRFRDAEAVIDALRSLSIFPGCDIAWEKELEEKSRSLNLSRKVFEDLLQITGGASEEGALDRLESCGLELLRLLSLEKTEAAASFNEGLASFHSFIRSLEEKSEDLSPEKLEREVDILEKKLGALRKVKRITGAFSAAELLDWTNEAQEAVRWLREAGARSSEFIQRGKELRREASSLAIELRALRQKAAAALQDQVNIHLAELGMGESVFAVHLTPLDKIRNNGADEVSFTLSSGGSAEIPVSRSASGGELSRILLALQLSLPDATLPPTLVFDEVEAGLGGKAALLAGYKLQALSRKTQVILVTHEATIAALADHHFLVHKSVDFVQLRKLEKSDRIIEIARMLSGDASLHEALEHAEKLLLSAGNNNALQAALPSSTG